MMVSFDKQNPKIGASIYHYDSSLQILDELLDYGSPWDLLVSYVMMMTAKNTKIAVHEYQVITIGHQS